MVEYQDADATIAEVLLDQRVMRGIGNVFRCELLWTCELHPWAKVSSLSRDECREFVSIAAEILQSRHASHDRTLAVYGRHGKECERCTGQVRVTHHGEANRVLYWCADCQNRHAGTSSSRYVTEHDTPPGVHPAEFIYLSELERARKSG
jgi:endonuclease-8